jgi:hypothetical protein
MFADDNPELAAELSPEHSCSLGEFAERAADYILEMRALHPAFGTLGYLTEGKGGYPAVPNERDALLSLLLEWAWDRKPPQPYTNLSSAGKPTAASEGSMGFKVSLTNKRSWDDKVDLGVEYGSTSKRFSAGFCDFMLPRVALPEFREDAQLIKRLMALVVKHWPVEIALYGLVGVHFQASEIHKGRWSRFNWINYHHDPSIADVLPSDVQVEAMGSGIVYQLGPRLLSYNDHADLDRLQRVRDALIAAGRLAAPAPVAMS